MSTDATGVEVWQRFDDAVRRAPEPSAFVVDERVLKLHPHLRRALRGREVLALKAGERVKRLSAVERLAERFASLPRAGTVVAVGGGTIGDLATVFAHLHKRGVRLVHVPTTLLAAVDSSVGGKGAVNVGATKNALGVFHVPAETWLCTEFFSTLTEAQRREGRVEAWKMVSSLDAAMFARWRRRRPDDVALLKTARRLKAGVCTVDPLETKGLRVVLNFGHTLGHVVESVSRFTVSHGDAVALGLVCALDVGRALDVTPDVTAAEGEAVLSLVPDVRANLAKALKRASWREVERLLRADKKGRGGASVPMVLIEVPGRWTMRDVPLPVLEALFAQWRSGVRPEVNQARPAKPRRARAHAARRSGRSARRRRRA